MSRLSTPLSERVGLDTPIVQAPMAGVSVQAFRRQGRRHGAGLVCSEMVSVALLKPDRMKTLDLFQYIRHLEQNAQSAHRYEIEFWKKVFYPISCLVMIVLAAVDFVAYHRRIPFAGREELMRSRTMPGISSASISHQTPGIAISQ